MRFYLSWMGLNNDPWPDWDRPDNPRPPFPEDHKHWPGVPIFSRRDGAEFADLGPTLSALFLPKSDCARWDDFETLYLLSDKPDEPKNQQHRQRMDEVIRKLAAVWRLGTKVKKRIRIVTIPGIDDPTEHQQIMSALEGWLKDESEGPLRRFPGKATEKRQITINLSQGTPAAQLCWLMLYWNGSLGSPPKVHVDFVQGDGGPKFSKAQDDAHRQPLRPVPVVRYALAKDPDAAVIDSEDVKLTDLTSAPFQHLMEDLEQAARLRMRVLLYGPRGVGKTFLAQHFHERRQHYRREEGRAAQRNGSSSGSGFITVTLSEYADVKDVRDHFFGWKKGAYNNADEEYHGFLKQADQGTLFLDEIHRLDKSLQAALLRPLNDGSFRPIKAEKDDTSDFDLVVATNDSQWCFALADDFRDRIVRIVLTVPSFDELRRDSAGLDDLWTFFCGGLRKRCTHAGVKYVEPTPECAAALREAIQVHTLPGNWRDFHRLADHILMRMVDARERRPPPLTWDLDKLASAVAATFPTP
jgi:transcriptional regulator with AAA-type ATPase domain